MFKKVLHQVIPYLVQLRENRLKKKYQKKKQLIAKRLAKERKQSLNKLLKANRSVTKV